MLGIFCRKPLKHSVVFKNPGDRLVLLSSYCMVQEPNSVGEKWKLRHKLELCPLDMVELPVTNLLIIRHRFWILG